MSQNLEEFCAMRTALQLRVSPFLHSAVILLTLFVLGTVAWSILTSAKLVVVARGGIGTESEAFRVINNVGYALLHSGFGGRVEKLCVREGDRVRKGAVLARLDDRQLVQQIKAGEEAVTIAEEELRKLDHLNVLMDKEEASAMLKFDAELARLRGQIARQVKLRETDLEVQAEVLTIAQENLKRIQQLHAEAGTSHAKLRGAELEVSKAKGALRKAQTEVDRSDLDVLREARALSQREYSVRRLELQIKRSQRQSQLGLSRSDIQSLEAQRDKTVLRSPVDGVVLDSLAQVGEVVGEGVEVFRLAEGGDLEFRALASHEDIGRLAIGMPVRIKLDAFDHRQFGTIAGSVLFLSPSARVVTEASGRKQSGFLVRIAILLDGLDPRIDVRALKYGMTGRADIVTDEKPLLEILLRVVRQSFVL